MFLKHLNVFLFDDRIIILFKDFKMKSLPWSRLFKADNSKILDRTNGL
jgi:hypothetical protein